MNGVEIRLQWTGLIDKGVHINGNEELDGVYSEIRNHSLHCLLCLK